MSLSSRSSRAIHVAINLRHKVIVIDCELVTGSYCVRGIIDYNKTAPKHRLSPSPSTGPLFVGCPSWPQPYIIIPLRNVCRLGRHETERKETQIAFRVSRDLFLKQTTIYCPDRSPLQPGLPALYSRWGR